MQHVSTIKLHVPAEGQLVPISLGKSAIRPSTQGAASSSEDVIRQWIGRFAHNCGQTLTDERVLLWIDELGAFAPEQLEQAFRFVLRSHTINTIPQIGAVCDALDGLRAKALRDNPTFYEQRMPLTSEENENRWKELRARGEAYRKRVHEFSLTVADLRSAAVRVDPEEVVATNERLDLLEKQKREILTRFATKV